MKNKIRKPSRIVNFRGELARLTGEKYFPVALGTTIELTIDESRMLYAWLGKAIEWIEQTKGDE